MQIPSNDQDIQGLTWAGGPTHHVQKQHIPGYCGHVHGLQAENLYGQPFAKLTAETFSGDMTRGFIIDDKTRFKTTSGDTFAHPRGGTVGSDTLRQTAVNILTQTQSNHWPTQLEEIPPIDRIPVSGYQGYRATYRNPVKKVQQTQSGPFNATVADIQVNYIQNHTEQRMDLERPVPVVGYTGFVQGAKAKNIYARNYHNIVMESKVRQDE